MRAIKQGWINEYLRWIEETSESPRSFHYWSAATIVAAAIKRNCWVSRGDYNLFPNMFTILVGHTGLGKGRSINPAVGLLRESGCSNILSDKLTIQYILEKISDRGQAVAHLQMTGGTVSIGQDASCFVSAPEIEDLLMASDAMPSLKEIWECKDGPFEYGTRGRGLVKIAKPCPTMLGGCTPSQIAVLFPSQAVGGGFVRRCNFVYEGDRARFIVWPTPRNGNDPIRQKLVDDLRHIATLRGCFQFDKYAKEMFAKYYVSQGADEFADEATASYETSKPYHALKLAMAMTASKNDSMMIDFVTMGMAINMVDHCAADLKKVFRSVGDSELTVVIDKVMRYIEAKSGNGHVTRSDLMAALWKDVGSSANLDLILGTLEQGNFITTLSLGGLTVYKIAKAKVAPPQGGFTIQ